MYTGANYDEFLTMKYMLARNILQGRMNVTEVAPVSAENAKTIVSTIKGVSNIWEFPSTNYNLSGVTTQTDKRDQIILLNAKFDAVIDVEVLAVAFNMEKAEFMGNRILVDSFGSLDTARLDLLFKDDPNYVPLSQEELSALDAIPAVMVDRDWFMILTTSTTSQRTTTDRGCTGTTSTTHGRRSAFLRLPTTRFTLQAHQP